jgi:hypothetical protein
MNTRVYIANEASDPPEQPGPCEKIRLTGRVEYVKVVRPKNRKAQAGQFWVIAHFDEDGNEDFGDQEFGQISWVSYTPSEQERAFARNLLASLAQEGSGDRGSGI